MSEYTDNLTAEQLIRYIANDYVELSHEKIENQRNQYIRICNSWLKINGTYYITEENPSADF